MFHFKPSATSRTTKRLFLNGLFLISAIAGTNHAHAQCSTAPEFDGLPATITVGSGLCGADALSFAGNLNLKDATDVTFDYTLAGATSGSNSGTSANFNIGTTHVTVTAHSDCGSATRSFDVVVRDNENPVFAKYENITQSNDADKCGAVVNYAIPTLNATGNCAGNNFDAMEAAGFVRLGDLNGHSYFRSPERTTWEVAEAAAQQFGAHLVSITSKEESEFIASIYPLGLRAWIGATDKDEEGKWKWISGEPMEYENWSDNQPDNGNGAYDQDYGMINSWGTFATKGQDPLAWDDSHSPLTDANYFYGIVEIATDGNTMTLLEGPASGSEFPLGTTKVKYLATDGSGNQSTLCFTVTVEDKQAPVASCKPATIYRINGTATLTPAMIDNGSSDLCGAVKLTASQTSFTAEGTYDVVLTVTDASGNTATCTSSVTVSACPSSNLTATSSTTNFVGGTFTNSAPEDMFIGYGPKSITLTPNPAPAGNVTYIWSGDATSMMNCTGCQTPTFTPTVAKGYSAVLFIVDQNGGCTRAEKQICVKDIRDGSKVVYCDKGTTKSANINAVDNQLRLGATLGRCNETCNNSLRTRRMVSEESQVVGGDVSVYPNPTASAFFVEVPQFEKTATVTLSDIQGKVLEVRNLNSNDSHKVRFDMENNPVGLYLLDVSYDGQRFRTKIVRQ